MIVPAAALYFIRDFLGHSTCVPRHWKHAGFVAKNNAEPQMQKHCGVGFVRSKVTRAYPNFESGFINKAKKKTKTMFVWTTLENCVFVGFFLFGVL